MNTEIFRLAAILYADNNYEVNPKTIHRKVIESLFIENQNNFLGVHSLIDLIKQKYNLDFTVEEINEIVSDGFFFSTSSCKVEELKITLTAKRYETIAGKITSNNLEYFISEFHKANSNYEFDDIRSVIYSFLYEVFQTNITSFSKLINPNIKIEELVNINDYNLTILEIEIINGFLNWENDDKNKTIFDISNLALEYCLLTNKKGSNFKLENLKSKNFFLDTNIVLRAIGVNGENRKNRTLTFLQKFKEAKENLFISKFTDEELRKTITYHINQISKYSTARINSSVFSNFSKSEDFIEYYHRWRRNRVNDSLDLFSSHINSLVSDLKNKFEVKNDFKDYFDINDANVDEQIKDKASQINTFKTFNKNVPSNMEGCINDAKNIHLLEFLRNGHYNNIFDCKYYFISSDQYLRKWDYTKNSSIPIVLLPSQWMSILLRYLNRTSDDFKSFVSFLNINNGEKGISNENLQLILNGISEITTDFTQQNSIISEMINIGFKGILERSNSEDDIIEKAKLFAKSKLESDIEELQKVNAQLESKFEKYQANTSTAIENLKQSKDSEKNLKDIEIEKNSRVRQELINTKAKLDLNKYKSKAYYCIPVTIICLIFFFLLFTFQNSSWNMVAVYTQYANSLDEGTMQKEFCKWLWLLPTTLFIGSLIIIYQRLLETDKLKEKLAEYKEKWSREINQ
ncbi:hypothetical protein [Flavobacterium sp. HJJ]|uniref:hypothetical protein n=1 Tax=Flavobacterium sp. HJJ TaxID=2783792 RepID=UPI00188D78D5|nr:hypothetical protein [Flavobacterium sp. HJJ]MBF4470939.1 hypothetical protein [Flavobacterium sp. HJJ]